MSATAAVEVESLRRDYGTRPALRGVDFSVREGELFGLVGPNGGGKTTLFRILATLLPPSGGRAAIFGHDVRLRPRAVRETIGVVFQSPAIDRHLTVEENLHTQGRLHGLGGADLRAGAAALLARFGLAGRASDRAGTLSGGLLRRAEIAKGLLHRPRLLLLDEPSTGLDPGARADLWDLLGELRRRDGVTILLTTHLMEEAERCDRVAILSDGALVAQGSPADLKDEIGGDVVTIAARDPERLRADLEAQLGVRAAVVEGTLRLELPRGRDQVPRILEALGERADAVTIGRPTLLDVFVRRTGHRFREAP